MNKEELIKHCRYYKGEDKNPYNNQNLPLEEYDNIKAKTWYFERLWVGSIDNEEELKQWKKGYDYLSCYGCRVDDDVPQSLFYCIVALYLHRNELPSMGEFEPFYYRWKNKEL